jgi:tetratricopeptide (TPR) repeat protein
VSGLRFIAIVSTILFLIAQADEVLNSDHLLQRGKEEYRAARYEAAVDDLRSAAATFIGPDERQLYIDTGRMPALPQFEEALVYLALSNAKLGRDPEARDAIERLLSAERIAPAYKTLALERDVLEFEPLAARLVPEVTLPGNEQLARLGVVPQPPAPLPQSSEIEERTALSRAIQEQPVEHALPPIVPAVHPASQPSSPAFIARPPESLVTKLRRAQKAALNGDVDNAQFLFAQVASAPQASRSAIAAAATGLYRTSAYTEAVEAFKRLGPFARGEADLRYYDAVALYETGHYDDARRQLACALPYLETSDDVVLYRMKIEQTAPSLQ